MDSRNYTEVLIDGNIYTLSGDEDEGYMQRVASYINEKRSKLKKQPGFLKQSADYQTVMVELNMADDYFKVQGQVADLERQRNEMEKEIYSLKHELVSTQMKLEAALQELKAKEGELEETFKDEKAIKEELQRIKAVQAAKAASLAHGKQNGSGKMTREKLGPIKTSGAQDDRGRMEESGNDWDLSGEPSGMEDGQEESGGSSDQSLSQSDLSSEKGDHTVGIHNNRAHGYNRR